MNLYSILLLHVNSGAQSFFLVSLQGLFPGRRQRARHGVGAPDDGAGGRQAEGVPGEARHEGSSVLRRGQGCLRQGRQGVSGAVAGRHGQEERAGTRRLEHVPGQAARLREESRRRGLPLGQEVRGRSDG